LNRSVNAAATEPPNPMPAGPAPTAAVKTTIVPFTKEQVAAVRDLNTRLREQGVTYQFPEDPVADWLPRVDDLPLYHEYFVAVEAESTTVRGGYIYKQQEFAIAGDVHAVGFFRLPLSEGSYDKRFATLAAQFLLHALKKNPRLYSLGIGGYDEPLAKMEAAVGWTQWTVPFLFRIEHAFAFLRHIRHLRRKTSRRLVLDLLAWSGLGFVGLKLFRLWQRATGQTSGRVPNYSLEPTFGPWADDVWNAARPEYSLIAIRTSQTLARLFPVEDRRYQRLKVTDGGGRVVGWAVVLNTPHRNHKHFGDMRLGSLVDFLAVPGHEPEVVAAATDHLQRGGVDLIVVNTPHQDWLAALRRGGYLSGPSNFIFSASKKLIELLQPFDEKKHRLHWTRGDGDGPIHL
jgi:hypothetical protein